MNFEDIVDMDWVDSNTTLGETNDFSDLYFNQQQDFLLQPPVTPPQQTIPVPELKMEPLLTTMPTTEQIKQLIEVAKQQLALREQLQLLQQQQQQPATAATTTTAQQATTKENASPQQFSQIPTVAPSTIFAPPSEVTPAMPALSPSTIASTDMALVPPITKPLSKNNKTTTTSSSPRRDSLASMPEESISLEAYAEADGIDLKSLTSKERRQLRNKISARNFRVRRKEYISTLEGQVNEHKQKAEELKEKLTQVENENKQLRKEMDSLKRQNQQLLQQQQQQQQQKIPSSPRIPKPNLNKDLSIMGTKATDSYRQQDNCILVSNAVMPVWDLKSILKKPITTQDDDSMMAKLAGQYILMVLQLSLNMKQHLLASTSSSYNMEYLYDTLIQSALLNNATADKSFLWV